MKALLYYNNHDLMTYDLISGVSVGSVNALAYIANEKGK